MQSIDMGLQLKIGSWTYSMFRKHLLDVTFDPLCHSRHFAAVSTGRYEEVWLMSETEVKLLVEQALEIDRLLHEQQLGVAWERPPVAFTERPGHARTRERNRAQRSALQAASHLVRSADSGPGTRDASAGPAYGRTESVAVARSESHMELDEESQESAGKERGKVSTRTVKRLLEVLCDEAVSYYRVSRVITL